MTKGDEFWAPYAPANGVLSAIRRYRERGLPEPVDHESLESIGIPGPSTYPVLQALKFLGLVDEEGRHTDRLEALRLASTADYPNVLADTLKNAYQYIFQIVDPNKDSRVAIEDAFRRFEPASQRQKMVALFVSLSKEAGFLPTNSDQKSTSPKPVTRRVKGKVLKNDQLPLTGTSEGRELTPNVEKEKTNPSPVIGGSRYEPVHAVVRKLPEKPSWTHSERERWLKALEATVDLVIDISDVEPIKDLRD